MKKNQKTSRGILSRIASAGLLSSALVSTGLEARADVPISYPMGGYTTAGMNTPLYFGFDNEDGTNVAVRIINAPTNGVVSNISGNRGTYLADTNYFGLDGFNFYVEDSSGLKSTNNATFYVKEGDVILTPTLESISSSNGVTTLNAMIQPAPKVTDVERRTTLNGIDTWVKVGEMTPQGYSPDGLVPGIFVRTEDEDLSGFFRVGTHKQ